MIRSDTIQHNAAKTYLYIIDVDKDYVRYLDDYESWRYYEKKT